MYTLYPLINLRSWFEHVLYLDEDETGQNTGDDESQGQDQEGEGSEFEKTVHIRTYKFKTPQFIV